MSANDKLDRLLSWVDSTERRLGDCPVHIDGDDLRAAINALLAEPEPEPAEPSPSSELRAAAVIREVVQRVAELPDHTSPDDWPEAMLVTADELESILRAALAASPAPDAEKPGTSTCRCGNVIKIGTIYGDSSRGTIECASCGSVAIRWGSKKHDR